MNKRYKDWTKHSEVGRAGETAAKEYLRKKGYKIIDTNCRTKYYEIDIIAIAPVKRFFDAERTMVFVEVRTKSNERWGRPEDTINYYKKKQLHGAAEAYLGENGWDGASRIDAVCVILTGNEVKRLTHYENIA